MAGKVSCWLYEKRSLKKPKLGPSDVYPQEARQKEDELTAVNVKQGFLNCPTILEEYGSARNANITPNKFGAFFSALLSKKQELNTLQDTGKKKQQINAKDNIWLVTQRSKPAVDAWFRDLSSGTKTLTQLSRKFPIFNKKEEIFLQLYEFQVPMLKAIWFIKMSSAYSVALSETANKSKKRQVVDQSQEWTSILCKVLRELYHRICEYYHSNNSSYSGYSSNAFSSPLSANPNHVNMEVVQKQWQYTCQLARCLFEEGLLDKQDFLNWLLDLIEKVKSADDPVMKVVVPLLLQYIDDLTESELCSRKLAYHCAVKLNQLLSSYNMFGINGNSSISSPVFNDKDNLPQINGNISNELCSSQQQSTLISSSNQNSDSTKGLTSSLEPLIVSFRDLLTCPHHRTIALGLSAIIQVITLNCPTALVWHGEVRLSPALYGSPLDHLPYPPSSLPMPSRPFNRKLIKELRNVEEEIRIRSVAVENKWCSDRSQQTAPGLIINRLLNTLDTLDRFAFEKVDSNYSIDTLYAAIFKSDHPSSSSAQISLTSPPPTSSSQTAYNNIKSDISSRNLKETIAEDEPVIKLLCEWAVTTKRTGEHRALVVAKLLEKRQNELLTERENKKGDDKDGDVNINLLGKKVDNTAALSSDSITPIYQELLMSFLDTQAPDWFEKNSNYESKLAFSNLVLLFGEFVRCDVFSHDSYMCALISRGQFANSPISSVIPQLNDIKIPTAKSETNLSNLGPNTGNLLPSLNASSSNLIGSLDVNTPNRSSESSLPMFEPVLEATETSRSDPIGNWAIQQSDMDDAHLDADIGKLVQVLKERQQNNMNDHTDILLPDSVNSDKEDDPVSLLSSIGFGAKDSGQKSSIQRHLLYTTHFPLPQDESTNHDCNQRHVLLYGVGKARDEARHVVKKTTKEILKLFSRKSSMDISDGAKVKKKESFSFESALAKFQSLAYFDQHVVTSSCASACIEMFEGVANGTSVHLPLLEAIAFLFDLMEMALNIHGLVEFCIQLLKEMPDLEIKLMEKCPLLVNNYCTHIGLYIVGVLYRYQSCLLLLPEETVAVFEGLYKLVKNVSNFADCSSAERCILCYLFDLYSNCAPLKSKYFEQFNSIAQKIKQNIHASREPSSVKLSWNSTCMSEYINNPKLKVDSNHLQQLNENAHFRYSFVCNAVHAVSTARDASRLNDLSILCAELSSRCPALGSEWLGVLKALCCSYIQNGGFAEVLAQVRVSDLSVHDNIAVFTCILIARRCFSPQDVVIHCALPSLLAAATGGSCKEAEPGARLTCHILLCLFSSNEPPLSSSVVFYTPATTLYSLTSPGPSNLSSNPLLGHKRSLFVIKHPCDRYLLVAANMSTKVEAVLTILKAILLLGDSVESSKDLKSKSDNSTSKEPFLSDLLGNTLDDTDYDYDLLAFPGGKSKDKSDVNSEAAGLNDYAKYVLQQICAQEWILERCLRDPDIITKHDVFLDPSLTPEQALQLLQMICNQKSAASKDQEFDQKVLISKVFQNLDEWTIRESWLQLQLMYAQCLKKTQSDVSSWLDLVAKAAIDFFQQSSEETSKSLSNPNLLNSKNNSSRKLAGTISNSVNCSNDSMSMNNPKDTRIWLIWPLISKLHSSVQGKILKVAANVLETGNWMNASSSQNPYPYKKQDRGFSQQKNSSSNNSNNPPSLLSYPPFLALVLMCLRGRDEQRESLLNSLYSQLSQALHDRINDDVKIKYNIQEGLQLRLSLVGGMFDIIHKSTTLTTDWAVLLVQLISNSVVDPQSNYDLFTTVLDMLAVLIHTTQSYDASESREETRKQYQNLIKKLKKEFPFDRVGMGINIVKQLLPISKQQSEVITCEPMGSLIDTKGNKIAGFAAIDKKQGLQVAEKQKVSPWDLLEGHKNPAPLNWTWFGAVRIERKPLRGEENHNVLAWHTHTFKQPTSYYLECPPLPPEEAEPTPIAPPVIVNEIKPPVPASLPQMIPQPPQIQPNLIPMTLPDENIKRERDTPIMDSSPRTAKKAKTQRKKRTPKNVTANTIPTQMPNQIRITNYEPSNYSGPPQQQPPPQQQHWFNQQGNPMAAQAPHQGPPPQNQQFYQHPQGPGMAPTGPRFERPMSKPKAILNTIIKNRQPASQQPGPYMANGPPQNAGPGQMAPGGPGSGPHMYQRGQIIMTRQMRPRQQHPGQPQMNMPQNQMQNSTQMYQMQPNNQVISQNVPNSMHHLPSQSQSNFGGPPQNMVYANQMQMSNHPNMEPQMVNSGHQQPYQQQPTQMNHNQMMIRNQAMHHHQQGPPMGPPQPQQPGPQQMGQQYMQPGHQNQLQQQMGNQMGYNTVNMNNMNNVNMNNMNMHLNNWVG